MIKPTQAKIVSYLQGGLGNQCFIYAAGRVWADRHQTMFCLDTSYLLDDAVYKRPFTLGAFNIRKDEMTQVLVKPVRTFRKLRYKLISRVRVRVGNYCCDAVPFKYRLLPDEWSGTLILDGYWQSEKYFRERTDCTSYSDADVQFFRDDQYARQVAKDLTLKDSRWFDADPLAQKIKSTENAVFLHMRSYKDIPGKSDGSCALPMGYFENALKAIEARIGKRFTAFVFSDDVEWARSMLETKGRNFEFVDPEEPEMAKKDTLINLPPASRLTSDDCATEELTRCEQNVECCVMNNSLRDFSLMRLCKHGIVANSSFSWWAGWLGEQDWLSKGASPLRLRVDSRCMNDDYWPDRWLAVSSE